MFDDLDATLQAMLGDPARPGRGARRRGQLRRADRDFTPTQATVNLFLHEVVENRTLRETRPVPRPGRRPARRRVPQPAAAAAGRLHLPGHGLVGADRRREDRRGAHAAGVGPAVAGPASRSSTTGSCRAPWRPRRSPTRCRSRSAQTRERSAPGSSGARSGWRRGRRSP